MYPGVTVHQLPHSSGPEAAQVRCGTPGIAAPRVSAGAGVEGGLWGPRSEPPPLSVCREDLWVRGGRILDPERLFFEERLVADEQRDCGGCILAPGFIDVQINGMSQGQGEETQGRSAEHCAIPCFCGRRWIWR